MTKMYVLLPINYEYNDEVYCEEGYNRPLVYYNNIHDAKAALKAATIDELRAWGYQINLFDCYDDSWFHSDVEFVKLYNELTDLQYSVDDMLAYDFELAETLSDEDYEQILPYLNINFFEIVEVKNGL